MPNTKVFLFIVKLIVLLPLSISATSFDHANVIDLVKKHLEDNIISPEGGRIAITIANIDPRIIIRPCQQALNVNIPENHRGRNVNVKISCDDSMSWVMYLPAKIEKTFPVLVAKITIEKGMVLTEGNIALQFISLNKIRGKKLSDKAAILGSKAKKRIAKGKVITPKSVCLICKGDSVTIIAESDSFMIKTRGTAISDGNLHQQIRVKNSRSGKIITPKVSAMNQVTIHL